MINQNFTPVGTEQNLLEDLIIESIQIYGTDIYYLPRTLGSTDAVLNEDDMPEFNSAHIIEMHMKESETYSGNGDFLSHFGVQIQDSITMTVARKTFDTLVKTPAAALTPPIQLLRPREGDLIFFSTDRELFEIVFVEDKMPLYQLGKLYIYNIQCENLEYSDQRFNTGISEIDNRYADYAKPNIEDDDLLTGQEDWDPFADNLDIEKEAIEILDFNEINPFGEIN